jgi:hypothetical protein
LNQLDPSASAHAARLEAAPFTAEYYAGANERFGVAFNSRLTVTVDGMVRPALITDYNLSLLHIGWYSDWKTNKTPLRPDGIKYVQLIKVKASEYPTSTWGITETLANPDNLGMLWIVGNEPEGKYSQGNRTPTEYAQIYHDVYSLIKNLDHTALVAIGGVIEPTPLRLKWLDMVLNEYQARFGEQMPVDVWNIHVQILQEVAGTPADPLPWGAEIPAGLTDTVGVRYTLLDNANPDIFRQLVTDFRRWMKARGFQHKPLIISEYGALMPSTYIVPDGDEAKGDQAVIAFMRSTFDFLVHTRDSDLGYPADDYRLVQQWIWYSLNSPLNGRLFSDQDPRQMTKFGVAFHEYMWTLIGYPRALLPMIRKPLRPAGM